MSISSASSRDARSARNFLVAAVLLLLSGACGLTPDETGSAFDRFAGPNGSYIVMDSDVHGEASFDADPSSSATDLEERAVADGLDFAVMTEHSNSAGSIDLCRDGLLRGGGDLLSCIESIENAGPDFAATDVALPHVLPGVEITLASFEGGADQPTGPGIGSGLIGCLPRWAEAFDDAWAIVDRPLETVHGADAIATCQDLGGMAVLRHPFGAPDEPLQQPAYDWSSRRYDGIQVMSGSGWDAESEAAWDLYLCDRLAGRTPFAVGASDFHGDRSLRYNGDAALGRVRTSTFASGTTWGASVAGLRAGRTVVHTDDSFLEIRLYDADGDYRAMQGDQLQTESDRELRIAVRGRGPGEGRLELALAVPGRCDDPPEAAGDGPPTPEVINLARWKVCDQTTECSFHERFVWELPRDGYLYARYLGPDTETGQAAALLAPIKIRASGSRSLLSLRNRGRP